MADKKTKKEIKTVLDKYVDYSRFRSESFSGMTLLTTLGISAGTVVALVLDTTLTGGITSAAWLAVVGGSGSTGLLGAGALIFKKPSENAIGQKIKYSNIFVPMAFNKMGSKLKAAFNIASAPEAKPEDKNKFILLAEEIGQDVQKLSPAFTIISGGPNGAGTDKYEFTIDKGKRLTLTQALHDVMKPPAPKKLTLEEEVQILKQQVEELKNPKVIKLEKNPPRP